MQATYLSTCCSAPLLMQKKSPVGGDSFYCQECKKECGANAAVSHCCRQPIFVQPNTSFPFICSCCNGDCELGNPNSPTVEEMLDAKVLGILNKLDAGEISVDTAWTEIISSMDEEIGSVMRNQMEGLINTVKINGLPESVAQSNEYILRGYDMARHAFVHIIQEALLPEK